MAKLLSTIIDGFLSSKNFVSGFVGSGWKIWKSNDRYKLEIDDLVIRNTMTVFELMISKIRAVKGALGISQASGKVKSVREDEENYYLEIEEEVSFKANDIVRCMEFTGNQRSYWVIVSGADGKEITIPKSEFGETIPLPGDELIQFGNTTDKTRQSAIYLHADENGVPAIDVLFDIHEKSFDGCVKVRLGGALPGEAEEYKGFFCKNGLIKSVNEAGEEMYKLRPDGSGFVAKGNINWDADGNGSIFHESIYWDTDGFHFGSGVKLTWDNLSDDAKANLKGEKGDTGPAGAEGPAGKDANLLPWVEDWDNNKTQIGGEAVISPKIFSGRKNADNTLTGVALGRGVVMVDGMEKTGIFGLKNGKLTFSIDAETGEAYFEGVVKATGGIFTGSISEPFQELPSDAVIHLDYKSGFNFSGEAPFSGQTYYLPEGIEYNGVKSTILNTGMSRNSGTIAVKIDNNGTFLSRKHWTSSIKTINLNPGTILELVGFDNNGYFYWYILNHNDFSINPDDETILQ